MATPHEALRQLRQMARTGELDRFCDERGIHLLVASGSAVDPAWPAAPRDLDIAVLADEQDGPWGFGALVADLTSRLHLDIDVMDLRRAGPLPRAEALTRCEPLYERRAACWPSSRWRRSKNAWRPGICALDLDLLAR